MGCDIHAHIERRKKWENIGGYHWIDKGEIDIGRDYEVFALLADVRNDDGIKPIAMPKGEPLDDEEFSPSFQAYYESWGEDAHSVSYLTLAEMKNADLNQEFYDSRVIIDKDASGKITGTAKMTTGKHYGEVGNRKLFGTWGTGHWESLVAQVEKIKEEGDTDEDVRLVFFFDN